MNAKLDNAAFGANGLVADTKAISKLIHPERDSYDKMGVLQEAVSIIRGADAETDEGPDTEELEKRLRMFCDELRPVIESSEQAERRETGKQAVVRVIREFSIRHRESATVYDVERLLLRLESEAELLGEDGASLGKCLRELKECSRKLRAADQERLTGDEWGRWRGWIAMIRKDPLGVDLQSPTMNPEQAVDEKVKNDDFADVAPAQHPQQLRAAGTDSEEADRTTTGTEEDHE